MKLIFVHGWSVTNTNTYGEMPQALAELARQNNVDLNIDHIYLGRYVSFHDEVTVDDISRALDRALRDLEGNNADTINDFSCITHSTGGPVVRHWLNTFYGKEDLAKAPLKHLIMLAPANHGSALGALGKKRLGRIKSWFNGVEPGQRVLDWLCLGSEGQWSLNKRYLDYDYTNTGVLPFVLVGQKIDHTFYDFLNSYLVEKGSDGVVRVAGANMNYTYFSLKQDTQQIIRKSPLTHALIPTSSSRTSSTMPLRVYSEHSHSGTDIGIMGSAKRRDTQTPVLTDIIKCLQVKSAHEYEVLRQEMATLTKKAQHKEDRFCMVVFNVVDDQGEQINQDDYDILLLAGNQYQPRRMPSGFLKDKQMNTTSSHLVYYLNANKIKDIADGKFGIRVMARPEKGFSYYCAAEFRSKDIAVKDIIAPNQTTYVKIVLHRFVDQKVFSFGPATEKPIPFNKVKPSGKSLS